MLALGLKMCYKHNIRTLQDPLITGIYQTKLFSSCKNILKVYRLRKLKTVKSTRLSLALCSKWWDKLISLDYSHASNSVFTYSYLLVLLLNSEMPTRSLKCVKT